MMVSLKDGKELPFVLDTGSPITVFDKSLKAKLGKMVDTVTANIWGIKQKANVYNLPELYLQNVPLITGNLTCTCDLQKLSKDTEHPVMGILGMDCLLHYCIQLDFDSGKVRFLTPAQIGHADLTKLGKPYPLVFSDVGQGESNLFRTFIHHASLVGGQSTHLLIDTGLDVDGALEPALLQAQWQRTNDGAVKRLGKTSCFIQDCVWDGRTYTNLVLKEATSAVAGEGANVVGLRFLARHLVTFDFPDRVMFLQRQSIGPLPDDTRVRKDQIMNSLVITGDKLPEDIDARLNAFLEQQQSLPLSFRWFGGTLNVKSDDDPTIYHYTVGRKSKHDPWKLKKAWRTDESGHTTKEYPVT